MNHSLHELELLAPAKINLGLEVLRRRNDGYHDINTVFLALQFGDTLLLRSRSDGTIVCQVEGNPMLGTGDDNLCVRAATLLRGHLGNPSLGLDIMLRKETPIGAGLGGGSSDAAAVLMGAARLWGGVAEPKLLRTLALELGSDVPFFLEGGAALASGRGEELQPLPLSLPYPILLINPGIHVPTPWAYRAVGRTGERAPSDLAALLREGIGNPRMLRERVVNDFEPAVFQEYPLLAELKERLYDTGALFALMSGSGSTLFGIFESEEGAAESATQFKNYWNRIVWKR